MRVCSEAVDKNPKLKDVAPSTLQAAVVNVASIGLSLNPLLQHTYLVPEYNKQASREEANLRVSYKGLIFLATGPKGPLKWCIADVVHEKDTFVSAGKMEMPEHKFEPFGNRGKPIGVYCAAMTKEDILIVEFADWNEVMKAKKAAKTKYVWDAWEGEMAKKFIIKRASKQWPTRGEETHIHEAIGKLNEMEGSAPSDEENRQALASTIIEAIADDDWSTVYESWSELEDDEKVVMWTAKSKNGYFTTDEKAYIGGVTDRRRKELDLPEPDSVLKGYNELIGKLNECSSVEELAVLTELTNEHLSTYKISDDHFEDITNKIDARKQEFEE